MRIFALELDNDIKGIENRKIYIENLIKRLDSPGFVVLPELAISSYMASQEMWVLADNCGQDTTSWAIQMAKNYQTFIGVGYLDKENGDYFNRYAIVGPSGVCGVVTKSEGESAVFKRGDFGSVILTPFGKVGVAICYDSRRLHFYENIKDEELSLILFPHGAPADPLKPDKEVKENDTRCMMYVNAFKVPVVYVNCIGSLEYMPGKMGEMMRKHNFRMNGFSKIYGIDLKPINLNLQSVIGAEVNITPSKRINDIKFHGKDILPGNFLFRKLILEPDTKAGIKLYENFK